MGIFKKLFGSKNKNIINIDDSLGNILLTGNSNNGKNSIFRNYIISSINNQSAGIVIRNVANGFSVIPNVTNDYTRLFGIDISDGAFTEQFDPIAYLNDIQATEMIYKIFNSYLEFDKSYRMKFKEYIAKVLFFAKLYNQSAKINEFHNYSIEVLEEMNYNSNLSDVEKRKNERFFDSVRQDIGILESYFYDFSKNNIGFILSGNKSLEEILNTGKIVEVNLDITIGNQETKVLFDTLTTYLGRFNFNKCFNSSICLILDELPNDLLIESGFNTLVNSSNNFKIAFSIQDIALFAEKSNAWIDRADSIFFFQQNSNKNKEYCSEFFGTYEKIKQSQTQTYGQSKTRPTIWNYNNSYRSNTSNYSNSYTTTTEKERIYLPEVFSSLPNNQCIYFFRKNNQHGRLNVY